MVKMKKNSFSFLILLLCGAASCLAQTDFYVTPSGSDTNPGTSIALAWKTIQQAANTATPGSTVHILAGTYNELITFNVSGMTGNPVTLQNYQNDVVTLSGAGFTAPYSNLIAINSKSNIVIDGLILENLIAPFANGVLIVSNIGGGLENITLRNLTIRNIGFTANASTMPVAGDNAHGIEVYGQGIGGADAIRNIVIDSCEVHHNITGYSENITVNGNVDGFAITHCSVHDNTNIGIDAAGNFGASTNPNVDHARNGVIAGNETYANISPIANSSGIYCDGCWSTVIERNISHHNTVGITVGCEVNGTTDSVTVRNNFVHQNTFTGLEIGGYTTLTTGVVSNSTMHNNTCFHNDPSNLHGEMVVNKVLDCRLFHNILYSDGSLLFYVDNIAPQTFTSDHNAFYNTQGTSAQAQVNYQWSTIGYADYKTTTGKDAASTFANPILVNTNLPSLDLHLQAASPAKDACSPAYVPAPGEQDFDGENRANGIVDIGADEFYAGMQLKDAQTNAAWISIYPNPASQSIKLRLVAAARQTQCLKIYNAMGIIVHEEIILQEANVDVSLWVAGIYFVQLGDQSVQVKHFIKQ
jgi:hypothetical protein